MPIASYKVWDGKDKGYKLTAAVTKFRAVKLSTAADSTVSPVAAAADDVFGIAQNSVSSGEQANGFGVTVATGGITECEAGVAVAIGDNIVIDSAGRGVPAGTASAGTQVIGVALAAASGVGKRFALQLSDTAR